MAIFTALFCRVCVAPPLQINISVWGAYSRSGPYWTGPPFLSFLIHSPLSIMGFSRDLEDVIMGLYDLI